MSKVPGKDLIFAKQLSWVLLAESTSARVASGMAQLKSILVVIGIIISFGLITSAVVNVTEVGRSCGPTLDVQNNNDDLQANEAIDKVKNLLNEDTPRARNYKCYRRIRLEGRQLRSCYGLGMCNITLSADECWVCLRNAHVRVAHACGFVEKARISLHDCYMRFSMKYFYEGFRPQEVEESASLPDATLESTEKDPVP